MAGVERVFLIGNMFPVTEEYIKKEYTIAELHYIIGNEYLIKDIHTRATRYLRLVMDGTLKPYVDIMGIKKTLLMT